MSNTVVVPNNDPATLCKAFRATVLAALKETLN
jgi:hypothetical protein